MVVGAVGIDWSVCCSVENPAEVEKMTKVK